MHLAKSLFNDFSSHGGQIRHSDLSTSLCMLLRGSENNTGNVDWFSRQSRPRLRFFSYSHSRAVISKTMMMIHICDWVNENVSAIFALAGSLPSWHLPPPKVCLPTRPHSRQGIAQCYYYSRHPRNCAHTINKTITKARDPSEGNVHVSVVDRLIRHKCRPSEALSWTATSQFGDREREGWMDR